MQRTQRVMDVMAVKSIKESEKDDPQFTVPIKYLTAQAETKTSTLREESFSYRVARLGGVSYIRNAGKLTIKSRTFLRARNKLDRIENIHNNPEDHIFNDGGVSAD